MPTFTVVANDEALHSIATRARGAGRAIVRDARAAGPGTVYLATVTGAADARDAVTAALTGADLVLVCRAPHEVTDPLLDDLRRLGTLVHAASPTVVLSAEQRALLARLRAGETLGAAAAALHLSRRTADRRLAEARTALGVRTTAEALVTAVRLGLLADQDD